MTSKQFCYWLQGFMELTGEDATLTPEQMKMVREHLGLVFRKVTPPLQQARVSPPSEAERRDFRSGIQCAQSAAARGQFGILDQQSWC